MYLNSNNDHNNNTPTVLCFIIKITDNKKCLKFKAITISIDNNILQSFNNTHILPETTTYFIYELLFEMKYVFKNNQCFCQM